MAAVGEWLKPTPKAAEKPAPYKEQTPFMGDDRPYYGFISGSGAGKTFAGVFRLWRNATVWNPDSMGAIIVPDKSQFTDNIKPILKEFNLMERWDYNSVYTDEPGLVTENGQRILILSADNDRQIGRIKGKNLAYIWMDEEAEIDSRAREIADQRLRVGDYPNLFITTTPDGRNHTYDFFKGDEPDATERKHGRGTLIETPDKLAVVGVPSESNPAIDDSDVERMRRNLPNQVVAQEIEGQFVEVSAGVLTQDMLTPVSRDTLDSHELSFHVGVDVGVESDAQKARTDDSDYWAAAIIAHHKRHGDAFLVDVARKRGMTLTQGVSWLQSVVEGVPNPRIGIEQVQAQRFFLQACRDAGLPVHGVDQSLGKEDRIIQMSVPFERGDIKLVNFETPPEEGLDDRWQEFVNEWLAFPEGRHIDLVDATEIALRDIDLGGAYTGVSGDMYGRD